MARTPWRGLKPVIAAVLWLRRQASTLMNPLIPWVQTLQHPWRPRRRATPMKMKRGVGLPSGPTRTRKGGLCLIRN